MNCVYTYNGVNYSYAELAAALHGGLLEKLVTDGVVGGEVSLNPDERVEEVRVETDVKSGIEQSEQVEAVGVVGESIYNNDGDLTDEGYGIVNKKLDDIVVYFADMYNLDVDKVRRAYNISKKGEYVSSAKNILNASVTNFEDVINLAKDLFPNSAEKIASEKYSILNNLEKGETNEISQEVSTAYSIIQEINSKYGKELSALKSTPQQTKTTQDATKIEGAESVDAGEPSRNGKKVGEGNTQKEEVAEKEEEKEVVSPTEQVEQPAEFEEVKQAKEKFYKHTEDKGYVEVKRAKPVYIFGTEKAFYVKEGKEFVVSDAITGAEIGRGSTLNNAVASAEENAGSVQNLESARERFTDAYGKSPYAKLQEEFSFTQSIINNAMDMADVVENEALKDVEGTAQALENVDYDNILANVPAISISNKQEMIGERLKKIKSIKEKAEGTREWRAKKYNEFKDKYGEGKAIEYLNKEIKDIADLEISKLPPIPKSEYEIIDEKGSRDFSKIVKDLGFKESGLSWGGSPFDEEVGMVLRNQDDTAAIFIKPNDIDFYDEIEDTQEDITNGIRIELLVTKSEKRGLGLAKNLLKKVTDWADKNNADLFLTIAPQDELTTGDGLKKLYESFGFEFKGIEGERINSDKLKIAEAYHKAKADGSNPELVKAVEDLLGGDNTNAYLDIMEDKGIIKRDCE